MAYEVIKINDNTWRIEEDMHVRFFVLTGSSAALMIDSGMTVKNAREIAEELTDLPVWLINTHADPDHIGCNNQFDVFYMHPDEELNYYDTQKQNGVFMPVEDGTIIELGDRPLQVISLPGHTPGSIGLLDINNRALISGDPIQDGMIFMFGVQRDIYTYMKSLRKLDRYKDRFDVIYPSHGSFPVYPELIDKLYDSVEDILDGKYPPIRIEMHGCPVNKYDTGIATFLMEI